MRQRATRKWPVCPVLFAVVQSMPVSVNCGFPRRVISTCHTRDGLGFDYHDSGDEQVLQCGLHLTHIVLFCKYVINVKQLKIYRYNEVD